MPSSVVITRTTEAIYGRATSEITVYDYFVIMPDISVGDLLRTKSECKRQEESIRIEPTTRLSILTRQKESHS